MPSPPSPAVASLAPSEVGGDAGTEARLQRMEERAAAQDELQHRHADVVIRVAEQLARMVAKLDELEHGVQAPADFPSGLAEPRRSTPFAQYTPEGFSNPAAREKRYAVEAERRLFLQALP